MAALSSDRAQHQCPAVSSGKVQSAPALLAHSGNPLKPRHVLCPTLQVLTDMSLSSVFYYSDTYDMSHTFPNCYSSSFDPRHTSEFVWNEALANPFIRHRWTPRHVYLMLPLLPPVPAPWMLQGVTPSLPAAAAGHGSDVRILLSCTCYGSSPSSRWAGTGLIKALVGFG